MFTRPGSLRRWRMAILVALLPGAAFAAGGEAAQTTAAPASTLKMAMTLYAGGIKLGSVDLDAAIRGKQYRAVSNLETAGVVNAFWQSRIQATSTGEIGGRDFQPRLYDSFYVGRANHKQEVSLSYDDGGAIRLYANPPYDIARYPVSAAQKKDTFDPLSAIVYVTAGAGADAANPCNVTAPVFDGKRRYNIEIKKEKDTRVEMDNGLYKGTAILCQARYVQVAGFSQKVLDERDSFPVIHAWIVTFPSKIPGRNYAVPLRVWADTPYGVVAAVTTALNIDGIDKGKSGG